MDRAISFLSPNPAMVSGRAASVTWRSVEASVFEAHGSRSLLALNAGLGIPTGNEEKGLGSG
jgi:hypothetical protein